MKFIPTLCIFLFFLSLDPLYAQTGPWAKYNGKMKGEALIRDSDGGYLKEVQSIVEGGGDVNWQMEGSGNTPLLAAATAGHLEIVKFLLLKGADPQLKDSNGLTALDRAQQAGANDVVKLLKSALAGNAGTKDESVNSSPGSEPAGPWAKYNGKMKGEALIRDSDGGYLKEVQSIVEGGGDVNWQMQGSGTTPLMAAAGGGHLDIVKFLIAKGADPKLKDINGRSALERAELAGANDVVRFLKSLGPNAAAPLKNEAAIAPEAKLAPANNPAADTRPVNKGTAGSKSWAPFGSYKVGDQVKFFAGGWKTGTILETGPAGDYAVKSALPKERKYLIAREGAANWNDWTDWGNVTGLTREDYWTAFFTGDWRLGETMAVNTKTEGAYQRDEYSFHSASEALTVNGNGTYKWKTIDGKVINGSWRAADDGAGIVLLKAFQGINWTVRNETNSTEENIRGLQTARLTADGKMSIKAQRPVK